MRTETRSPQLRRGHPAPVFEADPARLHPRARQMAEAMREGATTRLDLIQRGFTATELIEFEADAASHARALEVRQVDPGGDRPADIIAKAKAAIRHQMPVPPGRGETQGMFVAWSAYCAARQAHVIDPHAAQRERCVALLKAFLVEARVMPPIADYIAEAVRAGMEARH